MKAWIGRSGTPHPAGPPSVSTIEDFKEKLEPLLDPELPIRVSSSRYPFKGGLRKYKEAEGAVRRILLNNGSFETTRHILGESVDKVLIAIHKDPSLVKHIFRHLLVFLQDRGNLSKLVDGLWVWEDMAYSKRPFSPPRFTKSCEARACSNHFLRGEEYASHNTYRR